MAEPLEIYSLIQPIVRKEIDDKIAEYNNKSQFNVVDIPAHSHTGVESPRISALDLEDLSSLQSGDLVVFNATASDNLKDSADTARNVGGNTTQVMKSIRIFGNGTVRAKCDYARNTGYSTQGFFSVNGTIVTGSVTDSIYPTYATVTADLTIKPGDTVEFTITTFQTSSVGYCKNFRTYYDKSTLTNQIVTD